MVKRATSLFKWFYSNVGKQNARFDVRLTVPVVIKLCYFFRIRKMTPSMISLLIAIACLPWVKGQFPKVCVNLESLKNKTCCPKPNGYHEPCGSDGNRGECQELRVRRWDGTYSHYQEFHKKDERHNWPNALFNRTCKCKSNFAGYDCSKCEYGYYGYDCKQKRTLKRGNFAQWTKEQKDRFMSYINKTRYVSICKRIFHYAARHQSRKH